jgi:hypothetical protein
LWKAASFEAAFFFCPLDFLNNSKPIESLKQVVEGDGPRTGQETYGWPFLSLIISSRT